MTDTLTTARPSTKWATKVFFGTHLKNDEKVWISAPTWDCDWYWGFGYLGNKNCHYHLSSYQDGRNINMYDALNADYALNPTIEENLWTFAELALTIYTLKEAAEVLGRGGSHMTSNPCQDIIKNPEEVARLNHVVIPACMDAMYELIK